MPAGKGIHSLSWAWLAFIALPPGFYAALLAGAGAGGFFAAGLMAVLLALLVFRNRGVTLGSKPTLLILCAIAVSYVAGALADGSYSNTGTRGAMAVFVQLPLVYLLSLNAGAKRDGHGRFPNLAAKALVVSCIATLVIWLTQVSGLELLVGSVADAGPGLILNRNHLGYFLAMGYAIAIAHVAQRSTISARWAVVALALGLGVLLTYSRGALAAVILVTAVAFAFTGRIGRALLAAAALGCVGALFLDWEGLGRGEFSTGRLYLWGVLLPRDLGDALAGRGVGYMWSLNQFDISEHGGYVSEWNAFIYAHNDFLFLTVELGLLSALAWGLVLLRQFRAALGRSGRHLLGDAAGSGIGLSVLLATIVVLTGQTVDTVFFGAGNIVKWMAILPFLECDAGRARALARAE